MSKRLSAEELVDLLRIVRNSLANPARASGLEGHIVAQERELERLREAVEMELRRHLCYTSDYSRERFWTQVDACLSEQPEEQRWDLRTSEQELDDYEDWRSEEGTTMNDVDSLRLELALERNNHRKDNEYLVGELERLRLVADAALRRRSVKGPLAETIKERAAAEQELDDALAALSEQPEEQR